MPSYSVSARVVTAAALATLAACGQDPASASAPGQGTGLNIRGTERLAWDQQAASAAELKLFRFAIYVDGTRSELRDPLCSRAQGPAGFVCTARLPALAAGPHTLELASFKVEGGNTVEGSRSSPLQVNVTTGVAALAGSAAADPGRTIVTGDGVRIAMTAITSGLEDPTDLAPAPDGRVFVAERAGRIVALSPDVGGPQIALALEDVSAAPDQGGLLALALDPQFERNRFIYVLHTTAVRPGELVFRVTRFREAGDTFAERAVLLDGIPARPARPAGSIRFGPDGRLYVALDDGGDPDRASSAASLNGKVLRLNPDGTTPADQRAANPIHSEGYQVPRGFDWDPLSGMLWVLDTTAEGGNHLRAIPLRDGGSRQPGDRRGFVLPKRTGPSGIAFYDAKEIEAFRGDLLIAAAESGDLLRVRLDRRGPLRIGGIERLLEDNDPVRAVAVGADGAVYVCTNTSLWRLTAAKSR